jgi:tetratricopeptide (TPR) repeat protein
MPVNSSARKKSSRATQRDLDARIGFMEGLVRRDPDYVDALQLLGDHYTQRGRYDDGLKVDEHLSRLEPDNPLVFYNLACSYSLTGQFDRAVTALQKAIQLGYRDFKWLAKDPDLHELRQQPIYRDIQNKIRRMKTRVC